MEASCLVDPRGGVPRVDLQGLVEAGDRLLVAAERMQAAASAKVQDRCPVVYVADGQRAAEALALLRGDFAFFNFHLAFCNKPLAGIAPF